MEQEIAAAIRRGFELLATTLLVAHDFTMEAAVRNVKRISTLLEKESK